MPYSKYLKSGQKILLRAQHPTAERLDALTVYIQGTGPGYLDLTLPYQLRDDENYPFTTGMSFEILSFAMGVGVRLTGHFHSARDANRIRITHNRDLQLIRRTSSNRREAVIGLRYTRGRGALRSFREQWHKNTRILDEERNLAKLPQFPPCRVNISDSGIRFKIKLPAAVADLCLLLMKLPDDKPPVCTLAEIVWLAETAGDDHCEAGMQFIQIREADRQRIDRFIRRAGSDLQVRDPHRAVGQD